jgi:hypothetical protein
VRIIEIWKDLNTDEAGRILPGMHLGRLYSTLSQVFGSALAGRSKERQSLAETRLPLKATMGSRALVIICRDESAAGIYRGRKSGTAAVTGAGSKALTRIARIRFRVGGAAPIC